MRGWLCSAQAFVSVMTKCLLSLGSNVGDRQATLRAALGEIDALPDVRLLRHSQWHRSAAIGGPPEQGEFVNAAASLETKTPPLVLLAELQDIEARHGRQRGERWGPRPLDLDLLLYGHEVSETELLTLPHPRMSFRRFVLEPAAEVAGKMIHPVIGWNIERLLLHLDAARDEAAVLSPSAALRRVAVDWLARRFGAQEIERPAFATAEQLWPSTVTSWLQFSAKPRGGKHVLRRRGLRYAAAAFPKLTILLDARDEAGGVTAASWSAVVRRPGRGPTLRLQTSDSQEIQAEMAAAIESVWPDLGSTTGYRLES